MGKSTIAYRKDIDGLRAIAVVPVVLFHADLHAFSGGFVGVDVFFVISGYLITSLITNEMNNGKFTIVSFYERRVRRIFPALFAVCLFAFIMSFLLFMPKQFYEFGRSLVATALFSSNVLFWREAGYFDGPADMKPLLHTWSLAVEEQFYIIFPIFLLLLTKFVPTRRLQLTCLVALVSFLVSIWGVVYQPSATFYLAPTRAWELLLGALLALNLFPPIGNPAVRGTLGIIGLGLIMVSVFAFSEKTPFPGLAALVPCGGTALIIYAGSSGACLVSQLLSVRPAVFLGLISYSLYLWHWPLIVFAKYYWMRPLTFSDSALLIGVSVLVASLSWRFIESPFRKRNGVFRRSALFVAAGAVMVGSIFLGVVADVSRGWPQRLPADVAALSMAAFDRDPRLSACSGFHRDTSSRGPLCRLGKPDVAPSFLFWGDSHAGAMMPAIDAAALASSRSGYYASLGGCAPLVGTSRRDSVGSPFCRRFNDRILDFLDKNPEIRKVIIIGRWSENFELNRNIDTDAPLILVDEVNPQPGDNNNAVFRRGLQRTIAELSNRSLEVVILTGAPDLQFSAPDWLGRERYFLGAVKSGAFDANTFYRRQSGVAVVLNELQEKYGFSLIPLHPAVCDHETCYLAKGLDVFYSDETHLSTKGAALTVPILSRIFDTGENSVLSSARERTDSTVRDRPHPVSP